MTESNRDNLTAVPRTRRGFTLAETLIAMLILSLVSFGMAEGIRFGVEQYRRSMMLSEARVLCSTLTSVIRGELANTTNWSETTPVSFYSPTYASEKGNSDRLSTFISATKTESGYIEAVPDSDNGLRYGELMLGKVNGDGSLSGNLLLGSRAYTSYRLRANASASYDSVNKIFVVTLRLRPADQEKDLLVDTFHVIPLNDKKDPAPP